MSAVSFTCWFAPHDVASSWTQSSQVFKRKTNSSTDTRTRSLTRSPQSLNINTEDEWSPGEKKCAGVKTAVISAFCQSVHHCHLRLLWDVLYIRTQWSVWYEQQFWGPAVWTQPWNLFFSWMRFRRNHIKMTSVAAATQTADKAAHTDTHESRHVHTWACVSTNTHSSHKHVSCVISYHEALLLHSGSNWEQATAAETLETNKEHDWDQTGSCCHKQLLTWRSVCKPAGENLFNLTADRHQRGALCSCLVFVFSGFNILPFSTVPSHNMFTSCLLTIKEKQKKCHKKKLALDNWPKNKVFHWWRPWEVMESTWKSL